MTRKDYELIADALADAGAQAKAPAQLNGVETAVSHIAVALAADNPRFDKKRFLQYIAKKWGW